MVATMDDERIRDIIERALEYFPELPLEELRVVLLPNWDPQWQSVLMTGGRAIIGEDGIPFILIAEGFDGVWPEPLATDIPIHELSHIVDLLVNGTWEDTYDHERRKATQYIREQEGWA